MTRFFPGLLLSALIAALPAAPASAQMEPNPLPDPGPTPTVFDNVDLVQRYQATITPEDLAAHLYFFASDFFEGRETTARGQKMAAHYLASQYRKFGLAPKGTFETDNAADPRRYLQPFPLNETRFSSATLSASAGEAAFESTFGLDAQDGQSYVRIGGAGQVSGGVVFAGYGISDEDLGYSDYAAMTDAEIDISGKWLLVLDHEPLTSADASRLKTENGKPSNWTTQLGPKLFAAVRGGAGGLLVVGDVGPRAPESFDRAVAERVQAQQGVGSLSLAGSESRGGGRFNRAPIYYVTSAFADQLLAPSGRTVAELQETIDNSLEPVVFEVDGATVTSDIADDSRVVESENVLAFIEGSDPELKEEVVVITSHYDHVGMRDSGEGDRIYNGADDDGSGTVAVLEIAEAFARAAEDGFHPRRSVLFMNVAGEEKGLLGSRYYTDTEPVLPLEKTVANLNIDMIGRFDPTHPDAESGENYVYIIGSNLISQELHDINVRVNEITGTELVLHERFNSKDDPNQFYRRSDHWNFGKNEIPFIFFFTGTHDDYHGLDDEPEKIEYDRMARIAQLIFATGWQLANQDLPPAVSGTGFN